MRKKNVDPKKNRGTNYVSIFLFFFELGRCFFKKILCEKKLYWKSKADALN